MEFFQHFFHLIFHIDIFLANMVQTFGLWTYVILFAIIFMEMGCVLTPFLPGDSLLFAAGAIAANSELNIYWLVYTLVLACYLGMVVNFFIGRRLGQYFYQYSNSRWLSKNHIDRAHGFFVRFGRQAVIISCFIAILRTFTPFIAGMANMPSKLYLLISLLASCLWVTGLLVISYQFGNVSFVKAHFSWFILALVVVPSLLPLLGYVRQSRPRRS